MRKCTDCDAQLSDDARFCSSCGRQVTESIDCPKCDAQSPAGAKYCFKCGTALAAASTAPAAAEDKTEPVLDPGRARFSDELPAPFEDRREPLLGQELTDTGEHSSTAGAPHEASEASGEASQAALPQAPSAPIAAAESDGSQPRPGVLQVPKPEMPGGSALTSPPPRARDAAAPGTPEGVSAPPHASAADVAPPRPVPRRASGLPAAPPPLPPGPPTPRKAAPRSYAAVLVALGALVGLGAYWSARHDDAEYQAEASRRMRLATDALPTTTQEITAGDELFSTRQAMQGLYGAYDPHLDGVLWTVSGAPREWSDWNGRTVFIKPLISRTDESGTRHVLVTNSLDVKDGLVVKEGAGCPTCTSLVGAALFERQGNQWVLSQAQRFLRVGGGWGAPPKVAIDFTRRSGVEVHIDPDPNSRRGASYVLRGGGSPANLAASENNGAERVNTESATPRRQVTASRERRRAASGSADNPPVDDPASTANSAGAHTLVAAALKGNGRELQTIATALKRQPVPRGDRNTARDLNKQGLALSRQGRYDEAAQYFARAHRADRGDPEIRENLGYALMKAGRTREAERALLAALETGPDRASAWGSLGHVYAKQGKREEALAMLRTAHSVAPDPDRVLDIYARQAQTAEDPQIRQTLAEAVTLISSAR